MIYQIKRIHIDAGGAGSVFLNYPHDTSDLYFWTFPDDMSSSAVGSVESGISAGLILKIGESEYRFKNAYVGGYTVFVARKSVLKTVARQKLGAAFPLASLLESLTEISRICEDLSVEADRSLRAPEAEGKMILPPASQRAGSILGFDAYGNPAVGKKIPQVQDLFSQETRIEGMILQAENAAAQAKNSENLARQFANEAEVSTREAEAHAERAMKSQDNAEAVLGDVKSAGATALNDITNLKQESLDALDGRGNAILDRAEGAAAETEEDRQAVQDLVNSLNLTNVDLQQKLCFLACAVKTVTEHKNTVVAVYEVVVPARDLVVSLAETTQANTEVVTAKASQVSNDLAIVVRSTQQTVENAESAQSSADYIKSNEEAFGLGTAYVGACRLIGIPPYDEWEQLAFAAVGTWHKQTI